MGRRRFSLAPPNSGELSYQYWRRLIIHLASYFEWLKNLSHVSFDRMHKRYEEMATRNVLSAVEDLTDSRFDVARFQALTRGPQEIDFVRTALAETMSDAYQQIRELQRQRDLGDLRTAAFVLAIERVAVNYEALGIFP